MGCLQSWILAFVPYGDQFFLQQKHHVVSVFLRGRTEKDPANMCSHGEIHFVLMFCFLLFDDGTVDQHFRYVIGNEVCPYFLFDILWLVRMVVAQANPGSVSCRFTMSQNAPNSFFSCMGWRNASV